MRKYVFLVGLLVLGGCTANSDRVRTVGAQAFQELDTASVLVLDGAIHYICETARVGPLSAKFNTQKLRDAWAAMCQKKSELPGSEPE